MSDVFDHSTHKIAVKKYTLRCWDYHLRGKHLFVPTYETLKIVSNFALLLKIIIPIHYSHH